MFKSTFVLATSSRATSKHFGNWCEYFLNTFFIIFPSFPTATGYLRLACCCDLPSSVNTVIEASGCPCNLCKISQSGTTRCITNVTGSARSPFGVQRWGLRKNPKWFTLHIIEASDLSHVAVSKRIEELRLMQTSSHFVSLHRAVQSQLIRLDEDGCSWQGVHLVWIKIEVSWLATAW